MIRCMDDPIKRHALVYYTGSSLSKNYAPSQFINKTFSQEFKNHLLPYK